MEGGRTSTLRTTAFLSLGAVVVHELRYRLAGGGGAESALGDLAFVTPVLAIAALLAVAALVRRLARSDAPDGTRRRHIWLTMSAALFGIFCAQELMEALLATGRPEGLNGLFGDGGWLAAPLALAVAAVGLLFVQIVARAASLRGVATGFVRALGLPAGHVTLFVLARLARSGRPHRLAARGPPLPA